MRIAIISWGSLVVSGKERGLKIAGGSWSMDGPELPVEFSRISQSGARKGCLTLVIDETYGVAVPTFYATSALTNLNLAITNLKQVENINLSYSIGYINLKTNSVRGWAMEKQPKSVLLLKNWAERHAYDAVIWTSLLPNFHTVLGVPFSISTAMNYLSTLNDPIKSEAYSYIASAPYRVTTPLRRILNQRVLSDTTHMVNEIIPSDDVSTHAPPDDVPDNNEAEPFEGEAVLHRFLKKFRKHA